MSINLIVDPITTPILVAMVYILYSLDKRLSFLEGFFNIKIK